MKSILTWNAASPNTTAKSKTSINSVPSLINNFHQNQIYQSSPQRNHFYHNHEKEYTPPKSGSYAKIAVKTPKEPIKESNNIHPIKFPAYQKFEYNKDLIHSLQNKITELNQEKKNVNK